MLSSVPESLQSALSELNPYFQEHLETDFKDQNERRSKRTTCFSELPNVFSINGPKSTLLKDMKLMKNPGFKIQTFELSMNQLFMKTSLEIEKLLIEAQYEMFNNESKPAETFNETGNILFALDNVIIDAIIPIYVEEDSFMAHENFSMSIKPSQITTKKSSNVGGKVESLETVDTDIEQSLINIIWNGLSETISFLIRQDLGSSIVEYSVSELFADEPEEMIDFSNKRLEVANKVVNTFLQKATTLKNKSMIKIPELNLSYKCATSSKPTMICFQGAELLNILNIKRRGTFCITQENDKTISLSGGFDIRELTMTFNDCWASYNGIESTGNCKLIICRSKLLFKVLLEKNGESFRTKIDNVQFCWIRDTESDFDGLQCLNNIEDEIKSYMEAFFLGEITSLLTNRLKELFEGILKQYDMVKDINV